MPAEVRQLTRDDVPHVADLFMRVFRKSSSPASESLKKYFADLYLDNPWNNSGRPSFVYCDKTKRVRGFVGAIPLPMTIGTRRFVASVAGNHMVDPDMRDPFAAVQLLRSLFASNPDLIISDSANEVSRALWTKSGASVLTLYSMRWVRILQPCRYALSIIPGEHRLSRAKPLLAPLCIAADLLGSQFFKPSPVANENLHTAELAIEDLMGAFPDVIGRRALLPDYTHEGLTWLVDMASRKKQYGALSKVAVRDASGSVVGWYMLFVREGDVAQVLQFASRRSFEAAILNHLFSYARARRCVAVMGGIDTNAVKEFSENQCLFFLRNVYTVAYTQDRDILAALLSGNAFISRLEGEWWTLLQGDQF